MIQRIQKKLFLTASLLVCTAAFSQLETFVKNYEYFITDIDGVKSEAAKTNVTAVFNEDNKNVVVVYINGNVHRYFQTSNVSEEKTVSGYKFQLIQTVRESDGGIVQIQLFDNNLRLLFGSDYIEFF